MAQGADEETKWPTNCGLNPLHSKESTDLSRQEADKETCCQHFNFLVPPLHATMLSTDCGL